MLKQPGMHTQLYKRLMTAWKIEREFLLVEGIQQTEFDMVMSVSAVAGNEPMRQQRLETITWFKCRQKGH